VASSSCICPSSSSSLNVRKGKKNKRWIKTGGIPSDDAPKAPAKKIGNRAAGSSQATALLGIIPLGLHTHPFLSVKVGRNAQLVSWSQGQPALHNMFVASRER
jgi:hypothetical protein